MKTLKPARSKGIDNKKFFDPYHNNKAHQDCDKKKPVCCCGYELIIESDGTYRCTGGNHRYLMGLGDIIKDKFGNVWLKKPEDNPNE
jgi:hypothetical protein